MPTAGCSGVFQPLDSGWGQTGLGSQDMSEMPPTPQKTILHLSSRAMQKLNFGFFRCALTPW